MIRLSIIVPFYNVEKYVEQCIRSLYDQDIPMEEYEVICVDDCSPDGSRAIVESLQKEYSNIQLIIHDRNKKLGGARNTGLKVAKGRYVWFVDSDDYVMPNVLGSLLRETEDKLLEILQFRTGIVVDGKQTSETASYLDETVYDGVSFLLDQDKEVWYKRCLGVWNSLYLRELLVTNEHYFVENLMFEDVDWQLSLYTFVHRVKHSNQVGYCYRQNTGSITHVSPSPQKLSYQILQQLRMASVCRLSDNRAYQQMIEIAVCNQLSRLRLGLKALSLTKRLEYLYMIRRYEIRILRQYCTWRTWLAIRYGITIFVPNKK